jgi:hypothetical protein
MYSCKIYAKFSLNSGSLIHKFKTNNFTQPKVIHRFVLKSIKILLTAKTLIYKMKVALE